MTGLIVAEVPKAPPTSVAPSSPSLKWDVLTGAPSGHLLRQEAYGF